MAYTDSELESFLADPEADWVERKSNLSDPEKVRAAICAFANDLPDHRRAGVVFIGVRDDGTPSGLAVTDELLPQAADMKSDGQITPPPSIVVGKRVLRGAEVLVIEVLPSDSPPVRFRGRTHIRTGPRRDIASAQDERILNERRRFRDRPYDVQGLPSATTADLSKSWFEEEYLPSIVADDVRRANQRTYEERLAATKLIRSAADPVPTVLGVLVAGVSPRDLIPCAYIQFVRISGTALSDPIIDEAAIDGRVSDVLRRTEERLAAHNWQGVDFTSAPIEQRSPRVPRATIEQLVRNAVMHRTYETTNSPIRIYWFDDRIEIHNPGGPFGEVTRQNFGKAGFADYRNPNLAEALKSLGFVQRFGMGISIANHELRNAGLPPVRFEPTDTHVMAEIRTRP